MRKLSTTQESPIGSINGGCAVAQAVPGAYVGYECYVYVKFEREPTQLLDMLRNAALECKSADPLICVRRNKYGDYNVKFKTGRLDPTGVPLYDKDGNRLELTNDMIGHGSKVSVQYQVLAWESEKMSSVLCVLRSLTIHKLRTKQEEQDGIF